MGIESAIVTDMTYPPPPNLPGGDVKLPNADGNPAGVPLAPVPFTPVKRPALMPNPYQHQGVNSPASQPYVPPQNYPIAAEVNHRAIPETISPEYAPPQMSDTTQPPQTSPAHDAGGSTFELISEGPQKLLEDVTWSNFKSPSALPVSPETAYETPAAAPAVQVTPQPYSSPSSAPSPASEASLTAGYPPMPSLNPAAYAAEAYSNDMSAPQTSYGLPPIAPEAAPDADVKAPSKPSGLRAKLSAWPKKLKRKAGQEKGAKDQDDTAQNDVPDYLAAQNLQYAAPLQNIEQNIKQNIANNAAQVTPQKSDKTPAAKPARSARFVFLAGLLSGLILGFVLLTAIGKIAADKEYETVSKSSESSGKFEKLNDDITKTSSAALLTTTDISAQ